MPYSVSLYFTFTAILGGLICNSQKPAIMLILKWTKILYLHVKESKNNYNFSG